MNLKVIRTSRFKKDHKLAIKRDLDIDLLDNTIRILATCQPLPDDYRIMGFDNSPISAEAVIPISSRSTQWRARLWSFS